MYKYLFVLFFLFSGCDQFDLAVSLNDRVRAVEKIIQEKCNVINRAESTTTSKKIQYIKILILKGYEKSQCENSDILRILTDYLEEEFGHSDIPLYIEYNRNNKQVLEEL